MNHKQILMSHGSGGKLAAELIESVFISAFGSNSNFLTDSALVSGGKDTLAFTTDSYVVDPIIFPGGDIGKLAVCGTINDLAVSGAKPLYLSSGFILEEGFEISTLRQIVESMAKQAAEAGVKIVAGDTKVVPRGKCDKVFINTAGIGIIEEEKRHISKAEYCAEGDLILVNGSIGDHGTAIMATRNQVEFNPPVLSDCAALNGMIAELPYVNKGIRFMRDATRGGLATVLCELAAGSNWGITIREENIPVNDQVIGFCEMFGFDPLYMANEGKLVLVAAPDQAREILQKMQQHPLGKNACIIGELTSNRRGQVMMQTAVGGNRLIDMLSGEQLPRIC